MEEFVFDEKSFREKLKDLRVEKGLTKVKLAKDLNVKESTITRWENGNRIPTLPYLCRIAIYFNVSTDYLLGLEN